MKKHTGYTLIELMVAIAVLAVLLTVGLPQMSVFLKGSSVVDSSLDLMRGLEFARITAIKENRRVSVCRFDAGKIADIGYKCSVDATGWDKGWFVYMEGNDVGNIVGSYSKATDGDILKVNTGSEGRTVTIAADSLTIDKYVSFTSRGTPKLANGASQSGTFRVCDDRGLANAVGDVLARGVVLTAAGSVRNTNNANKIGACP